MSALRLASDDDAIRRAAAQWTVRRDRGLSATEAIEFELWLAADPRHRATFTRTQRTWARLDDPPESIARPALAAGAAQRTRRRYILGSLAAAAALVMGTLLWRPALPATSTAPSAPALQAAGPREVTLADGTLVRLNAGGEVHENFTDHERGVRLTRGEAHFTVVPDPTRPFVVVAGTLRVRAVGTAFNVNLHATGVEVLVTEGKVRLATAEATHPEEPLVQAGQRAVVATSETTIRPTVSAPEIVITGVDPEEIARTLAWHHSLVRLGGATLAELALEFERRFGERIVIADPDVAQLRAGGRVRADEAENFAGLLATTFDLELARSPEGFRLLRKKSSSSR